MKPLHALILILALSETSLGRPVQPNPETESRPSFAWKKYLPTIGAIGIIGSLIALVFFGTRHDEAYNAIDTIDRLKHNPKLQALQEEDREYLFDTRIQYIGKENGMEEESRENLEDGDIFHGLPLSRDMPDTTGMKRSAIKKLLGVHKKLEKGEKKIMEAQQSVHSAKDEERTARFAAGEIIATDWKEAVKQAVGHSSEPQSENNIN
jgi:hypothetical protein